MPVAIITGGGGGIGRAAALKLAELGHHIALAGRTPGTLEAVADEIKRIGTQTLVIPTDVAKPDHVDTMVKRVMETWGQVNVLVNATGMAPMVPTHEVSNEQWQEILDTNLSSAFYGIRAVWPHMQRQHYEFLAEHRDKHGTAHVPPDATTGGSIINISSMSTRDPFPGLGAYAVAKSGLNMLTQVTAREGQPLGIRVFGVAPGAVETAMFRAMFDVDQVPVEDVLRPADVASVIADFVAGSLRHSTGETIFMNKRL